MDNNKTHEENIQKEFETDNPATVTNEEGKITSLGQVDPLKGRGITGPDDPEIQRIQALVGYVEVDMTQLPSGGRFYKEGFTINIRAARVGEIRDFSTMDETQIMDVDDKLNNLLMMCTRVNFGKAPGSYKDILEEDRIYIILSIRELTFKEGEAKLMLNAKKHDCHSHESRSKVELRTTNLDFQQEDDLVAKYYDNENKRYTIHTKNYGDIIMKPPTIGVMRAITTYIRKKEEENSKWDKSSVQILPYTIDEWRGLTDKDIFRFSTDYQGWDANRFSVTFRLAEKMKVGVKPELKQTCLGCGTEVTAPLEFPDGIKSLFVVPDISSELL